ncbi:hypothetical protein FJ872_27380 [Mesorhizobium sp. B2-5-9]|uniref:hypothetical protein n=1 Tax=Mesorhizobium sp. B2-5-9 TaxID=2589921 RepID=UPI00112D9F22|nr:hypothetical protein [Mesorhizobium sp. B2-5-9]TPK04585.1 hypothetical protein FJ872_27380 [Mesorhizobium sp. B2-5-9]
MLDALQQGGFGCESCSEPAGPGQVEDAEVLCFLLFDPQQVFDDGTLRPTAMNQVDFGGISTLREAADDTEFLLTVKEITANSEAERRLYGIAQFAAASVRYHDGLRLLGVYDTSLQGKPHHADLIAPVVARDVEVGPPISKGRRETLRKKRLLRLNEKLGKVFLASEFRDGLLGNPSHDSLDRPG